MPARLNNKIFKEAITVTELNVNGFSKLGSDAPTVKMKKLTGTTGANEGDATSMAHGLTASKIISCDVLVTADNGNLICPEFDRIAEYNYDVVISSTNVTITLHGTSSGLINGGNAITVFITYEE